MKKTKAIVTGGAGFIGSHLVRALLARGYEVAVVDNLHSGKREHVPAGATFHAINIDDRARLAQVFTGAAYVFHLAAIPSVQYSIEHPDETNKVNAAGTLNVLLAARDARVQRVIYSASSSAYGDTKQLPTPEDAPALPKSPYALQKYIGEEYCRLFSELYGLGTVSLRYFNVYGAGQPSTGAYASVIAKFLDLKKQGKPLTIVGDGTQTRDFVHVADVAQANILAAESDRVGKGEKINIGSGKKYSVNDIAEIIGGKTEKLPPRIEPHDSCADISRAAFLLGWKPETILETGLKSLLQNTKNPLY